MDKSLRLNAVLNMAEKCNCIADIGTDHAYIPIMLIKNNICKNVIAADINEKPLRRAENNIKIYELSNRIELRLGPGISVLKQNEADGITICGMGAYLICDIIDNNKDIFKNLDFAILEPSQHEDFLRKYLILNNYFIADEDLCYEDGKYYEIIKVKKSNNNIKCISTQKVKSIEDNNIYYEVSKILIEKKHPLIKSFIKYKIDKYNTIKDTILISNKNDDFYDKTKERIDEVVKKINELWELLKCL